MEAMDQIAASGKLVSATTIGNWSSFTTAIGYWSAATTICYWCAATATLAAKSSD